MGGEGTLHVHRKIHAFENSHIAQGDTMDTFSIGDWTCGTLICYDNNLPENGRVLALQGAEIVFAPHQTGGFDIDRAGMGRIPLSLWENREKEPVALRQALLGPKGRDWLMKWLPSRAYDNNCFVVFTNGVGIDGPEVRVGLTTLLDPEGIVLAQSTEAGDDMVVHTFHKVAREGSLAGSHMLARRPSLYGKIVESVEEVDTRLVRNAVSNQTIG